MFLTGIERVLKRAGVKYAIVAGAKTRTAHKGGLREVRAQMFHTTETADSVFARGGDAPTLNYVVRGQGYPAYNILYGRSGHVYVVACGTSAHAGKGSGHGMPKDQANYYSIGHSADANSSKYPITASQLDSMAKVAKAFNDDFPTPRRTVMHGEWAPSRRSDPTKVPGGWAALKRAISRGYWDGSAPSGSTAKPTAKPKPASNEQAVNKVMETNRKGVEVYRSNYASSKVIGTMHGEGYNIHVIKMQGKTLSWAQIKWKGGIGWVKSKHLRDIPGSTKKSGKKWPDVALSRTSTHTTASHEAWVKLLADVGYKDKSLTTAMQRWLKKLGYYRRNTDKTFGPYHVEALQRFLKDKGFYKGDIDAHKAPYAVARGPMMIRAEIDYLNDQRRFY